MCNWHVHRKYVMKAPNDTREFLSESLRNRCPVQLGNSFPNNKNVCVIIWAPSFGIEISFLWYRGGQSLLFGIEIFFWYRDSAFCRPATRSSSSWDQPISCFWGLDILYIGGHKRSQHRKQKIKKSRYPKNDISIPNKKVTLNKYYRKCGSVLIPSALSVKPGPAHLPIICHVFAKCKREPVQT